MKTEEFLSWLEKKQLLETSKKYSQKLKKIFSECLNTTAQEEVLILGDEGSEQKRTAPILTGAYYLAAKELKLKVNTVVQEPKFRGDKASKELTEALSILPRQSIIISNFSGKLGSIKGIGLSYRQYVKENFHRFTSALNLQNIPSIEIERIINAIDIDYTKMDKKASMIKNMLDNGKEVRITTDKGTDLRIGIERCKAIKNTGDYRELCKGGNIPAGEVYIPPAWKQVDGKVVIDGSFAYREGSSLIEEPITLDIKKGEVKKITGGSEAEKLSSTLDWATRKAKFPWGVRRIGELGIGINPCASVIGSTIIDEKTLGTAHIAIGSNYWFGGTIYAIIHLDQVFKNPVIKIDNKVLEL